MIEAIVIEMQGKYDNFCKLINFWEQLAWMQHFNTDDSIIILLNES